MIKIGIGGINMITHFRNWITPFFKKEEGQGMVEYALLVGLIAVVVIVALVALGPAIRDKFQAIADKLNEPTIAP